MSDQIYIFSENQSAPENHIGFRRNKKIHNPHILDYGFPTVAPKTAPYRIYFFRYFLRECILANFCCCAKVVFTCLCASPNHVSEKIPQTHPQQGRLFPYSGYLLFYIVLQVPNIPYFQVFLQTVSHNPRMFL